VSKDDINISDCWNQIGVWRQGDDVCPKLSTTIHCRNCDIYVNAGLSLLDRDLPEHYTSENTKIFQSEKQQHDDTQTSCLIFRIGEEWYAIKTNVLNEIGESAEIHSIPHNREMIIDGLVNIRGEMEICISFGALASGQASTTDTLSNKSRMIVVNLDSGKYTFQADEVMGIYKISDQDIKLPPTSISKTGKQLTGGVFDYNETHIGLVDETCMDSKLMEAMS
jgi:chemotaxis-related protein WspD